ELKTTEISDLIGLNNLKLAHEVHPLIDDKFKIKDIITLAGKLTAAEITKLKAVNRDIAFCHDLHPLKDDAKFKIDELVRFANDAPPLKVTEIGELKGVTKATIDLHSLHALKDATFNITQLVELANDGKIESIDEIKKLKGVTNRGYDE